jgi:DNA-binding transcriptional MerR regulator
LQWLQDLRQGLGGQFRRSSGTRRQGRQAKNVFSGHRQTFSLLLLHLFYRTRDVVELLGISRRQLQYWAQTDLVTPSATTAGGHRRYSFEDLVSLKATRRLIDAGVSVQRIRKSVRALRQTLPSVASPLAELVLVATGDVVLVFHKGAAFEAVSGQEWVFDVAAFHAEVDVWLQEGTQPPRKARKARTVRRSPEQSQEQEQTA